MTESQLNLFTKRRAKRAKPAKEIALHAMIADDLRRWLNPAWRGTHFPAGEFRAHAVNKKTGRHYSVTGGRLRRMFLRPGWPDLQFCGPDQKTFWLELKREGGRLSDEQKDIRDHLIRNGFDYLATSSYVEARDALIDRGILRGVVKS